MASTLLRRDRGDHRTRFMLLFYGVFGDGMETESYRLFGGGDYGLGRDAMAFFYSLYLSDPAQRMDPLVSPVLADLHGLPPVFLSVAGLDPLRDDSRLLAERLRAAGVAADMKEYPGVVHGFTLMGRMLDAANKALGEAGQALAVGLK
jgi:acetyl esterase